MNPPSNLPDVSIDAAQASPATLTPAPTAAPRTQATATPVPAASPAPVATGPRAALEANLRAGPGTMYARVGGIAAGQALALVGRNEAGNWYQLDDGGWIAGFLVANAPIDVPVVVAPPPSPAEPAAANLATVETPGVTMEIVKQAWDENDLGQVQTCRHFEYNVTDVRRTKSLWFYDREYVAQGEWLLVFVEAKNISSGTSYFGRFEPRLAVLTTDGAFASSAGDSKASSYASWMYQHGRFNEDTNPGNVLGLVEAYDVPLEPDMLLAFTLRECPDIVLSLGVWSNVRQADPEWS